MQRKDGIIKLEDVSTSLSKPSPILQNILNTFLLTFDKHFWLHYNLQKIIYRRFIVSNNKIDMINEAARSIPVYKKVDVLVASSGSAGMAAAICAARNGADTFKEPG